jgi:hypothetical protein
MWVVVSKKRLFAPLLLITAVSGVMFAVHQPQAPLLTGQAGADDIACDHMVVKGV